MNVTRRSFLEASALGLGAAALAGASPFTAYADESHRTNETGKWTSTSCQGCTSYCPVKVYVEDGRAIRVNGNPNCTATEGKACAKASLALQQLYDPDRIKTPMKRTNPEKGRGIDPGFIPITWDEALETIAEELLAIHESGESQKFMFIKGRSSEVGDALYHYFPILMGSQNYYGHSTICAEVEKAAVWALNGLFSYRDYDLLNCKYYLLWSTDPIASNRQQPAAAAHWGEVMDNAHIVVIDPRYSATAAKADRWLPIIPGTDGALACAIAHVILTTGKWNKDFVGDFKEGIQNYELSGYYNTKVNRFIAGEDVNEEYFDYCNGYGLVRWWNLVLKDTTPEWAAEICGIDADDIESVAKDFAKYGTAACSWMSPGTSNQPNGIYGAMAAEALNGLVGSYQNTGGSQHPQSISVGAWPDHRPYRDSLARTADRAPKCDHRNRIEWPAIGSDGAHSSQVLTNNLAEVILDEDPYEIKVLMSKYCNYAFSCTGAQRWEQALAKVPFYVCITYNPSESAQFADIVLPAKHPMFEQWGYVTNYQNLVRYISIEQPVVTPLWDAKADETELAWALAEKLRDKGFDNVYRYYSRAFVDPETGNLPTDEESFAEIVTKLRTAPAWDGTYESEDAPSSWRTFCSKGVFCRSAVSTKTDWGDFSTETGKYEFYSETLKTQLEEKAWTYTKSVDECMELWGYEARGGICYVPHYEPAVRFGDEDEYPYIFSEHRSCLNREGRSANLTLYQEFKDLDLGDATWDDVIKINPQDMEALGLDDGDVVEVESVQGSIQVTAKGWEGTRPGVVIKCYGQGHWAFGHVSAADYENAKARGGNNNEILPVAYDRISGQTARHGGFARVKIKKVADQ